MIDPTGSRVRAIERELMLRAGPERVWRAITDPEELSRWFGSAAELDLRPGGDASFSWSDGPDAGRYAARVEEVEPNRRFCYRWARDTDTPVDAGPSTLVEFDLEPSADGGCRLRLRESGFEREEDRQSNDSGWTEELGELEEHLEKAA